MDNDSGITNGMKRWYASARPFAAIVIIVGGMCVGVGVKAGIMMHTMSELEKENSEMRLEIALLRKDVDTAAAYEQRIINAQDYAKAAHTRIIELRAELIAHGIIVKLN